MLARRIVVWSARGAIAFAFIVACSKFGKTPSDSVVDGPAPASASVVPPTMPSVAPAASSNVENQPPLVQARTYFANGQNWLARFVLEPQALSPSGTPEEIELLAQICNVQGDEECVGKCNAKLGHKVKGDSGKDDSDRARGAASAAPTELKRAQDYVAKKQLGPARAILEPKLLNDTASKDEIVLLKSICVQKADRMCVALCDAKLR
ncbi:MAG: hypothetical protein FWD73_14965 [Polyangiaceae bacterium]|nr:hypothetical protein [Polyangiaceae bacterium]